MALINYIKETKTEMKHVSWPTRRQTVASTAVVILFSIGLALFLGLFDVIWTELLKLVI